MSEHKADFKTESPKETFYVYIEETWSRREKPIHLEYITAAGNREGYVFNVVEALELAEKLRQVAREYLDQEVEEKMKA